MLANDLRVLFMKNVWVCFGVWVWFVVFLISSRRQLRGSGKSSAL